MPEIQSMLRYSLGHRQYPRKPSVRLAPAVGTLVVASVVARAPADATVLAIGILLICVGCYASWASWRRPALTVHEDNWQWRERWYQRPTTIILGHVQQWTYSAHVENLELTLQDGNAVKLDLAVLRKADRDDLLERLRAEPIPGGQV